MSLQSKIEYSINLLQKAEPLALKLNSGGFYLAFSGGKDSQCLYHIAKMAGVKFEAHMQVTTIDPPELMKFVRKNYPDVELHRPEINYYKLIKEKKMLPLMQARYCCAYLKEQAGAGYLTLLGIRKAESVRRSKRNELEVQGNKYSNTLDQFMIDRELEHTCIKGKDKIMLSPVINWTEKDVWEFIRGSGIEYCKLYDEGYTRIGCIFCPMASPKSKIRDRQRYPGIERAIKKSIQYLIDTNDYMNNHNATADETFNWWVSNKGTKEYFAMLRKQLTIDFETENNVLI